MKELSTIKQLFTPIQPSVSDPEGKVEYIEVAPNEKLGHFIYCYWQLRTKEYLSEDFLYRVVSDGCIDILWEADDFSQNFITGFSNTYTEFPLPESFNYFGIRFLPTAFPIIYNIAASELTNRFESLKHVAPDLSIRLSQLSDGKTYLYELKTTLDGFFLKAIFQKNMNLDRRVYNSINEILRSQGTLTLEKDVDTGLSARQLRRLFKFYIGDTPKTFSKVVRFQNILKAKPSAQSLKYNKIFFDLGYYDQSHFIKDFKHMYGLTPTIALK